MFFILSLISCQFYHFVILSKQQKIFPRNVGRFYQSCITKFTPDERTVPTLFFQFNGDILFQLFQFAFLVENNFRYQHGSIYGCDELDFRHIIYFGFACISASSISAIDDNRYNFGKV